MSLKALIQLMERLDEIQQQLLIIAKQKVEPLKKGEMKAVEALVREESKWIHQLEMTETLRTKKVSAFLQEQGFEDKDARMVDLVPYANEDEQRRMTEVQQSLVDVTEQLKQQNQFNQQLIEESLKLVRTSLDLMIPMKEDISYSPNEKQESPLGSGHSLFDSKA
ncbi:flagellar protein FlgN [Halalkalibacter hemicellulosilyticus]|uniref:Flagellar protein n=1 Tax=Halalkalibacter hemicellulosilyticusJCM 9152 TaxID=1236971 RepID=W4QJ22_9BACI|nr:flagellar protein FlgN [Halalkalibacter hemicellulosilyticus]GAE32120.1 flagellar protein [Halalkalibacter hemicellulosilyticusJCM 9152]